ncbi:hypothetical protein GQ53DRAFT_709041 [Thozetella sp. PMI_491]|nr:hypothetical protein GQ53DRAFT_709041 [Thozetella sp. PMI_491]
MFPGDRPSARPKPSRAPVDRNPSTIRLRYLPSLENPNEIFRIPEEAEATQTSRPRASTDPGTLPSIPPPAETGTIEQRLGLTASGPQAPPEVEVGQDGRPTHQGRGRARSLLGGLGIRRRVPGDQVDRAEGDEQYYSPKFVDILDCFDPEVSTLSSITNVQNSLFVPSLGRYVNRQPTFDLGPISYPTVNPEVRQESRRRAPGIEEEREKRRKTDETHPGIPHRPGSLLYDVGERYAVLPDGVSLEGWSEEEVAQLNDRVRHMLHSRRSRMKRSLKAFRQYVKKPMGFLVTLYATLITLFGLAWVLFLIGWIYVGERQLYAINVIDYILVALFAIVGDGLAPFRAIDTYHMIWIVHYHRLTWKLRKSIDLPKLENRNDLPTEFPVIEGAGDYRNLDVELGLRPRGQGSDEVDLGEHRADDERVILTPKQQAKLVHHQTKFAKSHTFYKPHETQAHHAFPLNFLIAIVLLLDLHSCLQISLGACTWGIDPAVRPMALTATILSCSITANCTAGILISIGDHRTRKKEVIDWLSRQELTEAAMKKMKKQREAAAESSGAPEVSTTNGANLVQGKSRGYVQE